MLDHKQCEAFLTVIETGSFENAAKKLYITPSAISLRVQALEKSFGLLLINRIKPCTPTKSGKILLAHLRHSRLLEQNLIQNLLGKTHDKFFNITIAVNADSLATWLLPTLKDVIVDEKITVEFLIDDQSHTHSLLETGLVNACISTQKQPMSGCEAQLLGMMKYKMVARIDFAKKWFAQGINRESLRSTPAIIFNNKDMMHSDILLKLFGLPKGTYPFFLIPSSESFLTAINLGLGYGMVPTLQLDSNKKDDLINILPEAEVDIPLYWHHWKQQPYSLKKLTEQLLKNSQITIY